MTRKDFELIAAVLRRTKPTKENDMGYAMPLWRKMVAEFAMDLKAQNGAFKTDKFEKAAGWE